MIHPPFVHERDYHILHLQEKIRECHSGLWGFGKNVNEYDKIRRMDLRGTGPYIISDQLLHDRFWSSAYLVRTRSEILITFF